MQRINVHFSDHHAEIIRSVAVQTQSTVSEVLRRMVETSSTELNLGNTYPTLSGKIVINGG